MLIFKYCHIFSLRYQLLINIKIIIIIIILYSIRYQLIMLLISYDNYLKVTYSKQAQMKIFLYFLIHVFNFRFACLKNDWILFFTNLQKEPSRSVLDKSCSKNMQQIYSRTSMPYHSPISIKVLCNFIEVALQFGCSPVNLLHIIRTSFTKNTYGGLLLN